MLDRVGQMNRGDRCQVGVAEVCEELSDDQEQKDEPLQAGERLVTAAMTCGTAVVVLASRP